MEHHALHARRGLWLFHDWEEARALWDRLLAVAPVHHLCLMPDHVHLLTQRAAPDRLRAAMSGHSRWLGHRWGWEGLRLWRPLEPPGSLANPAQLERTRRTILLYPCRVGLVGDPLSWAFSTHRDATGLAWPPARRQVSDPRDFHAFVSRDRSVNPQGTDLPMHPPHTHQPSYEDVLYALSAVSRTPVPALIRPGRARRLLIHCVRSLTDLTTRELASRLRMSHSAVSRVRTGHDAVAHVVVRVIGDPRFAPLQPEDLRSTPMWLGYRAYLAAKHQARARDDAA
jgi:hypothetical protein